MTIFNDARGRVIDANSSSAFRLFGIALAAFLVVIAVFAAWSGWIPATSECSRCLGGDRRSAAGRGSSG